MFCAEVPKPLQTRVLLRLEGTGVGRSLWTLPRGSRWWVID